MEKDNKLIKMEELDARIEKINYDLIGLENRKKEMEDNKFKKQQEIEKLEKEKKEILAKTDNMNRLQKALYIMLSSKTDLKQVELINTKIAENKKEKENIQNKIDIQNRLYSDTTKEKEDYIVERKKLYIDREKEKRDAKVYTAEIQDLAQIYGITMKYEKNQTMQNLREMAEKKINDFLGTKNQEQVEVKESEEEEEME